MSELRFSLHNIFVNEISDVDWKLYEDSTKLLNSLSDDSTTLATMHRYVYECRNGPGYSSFGINARLILSLVQSVAINPITSLKGMTIIDLGCGPGVLVDELSSNGAYATGIDLNPFFVLSARQSYPKSNFEVGSIDSRDLSLGKKMDLVITSLTLDRVASPFTLLKNVIEITKLYFIIISLLPITGKDDTPEDINNGRSSLEYTSIEEKLTRGIDPDEDEKTVKKILEDLGGINIKTFDVPMWVVSSDGEQHYIAKAFVGTINQLT